ncbi:MULTISPECIES: hypothetical protein [Gordonia]|uniref:hypothetical protein n=1 Tax=Gordonia TaxID=2053 RepID=UPI0030FF35E9
MAIKETGDSSSADAYVAFGGGAFQVYDSENSGNMSAIVGAMLDRPVHVIAGDWRGVQYWIDPAHGSVGSNAVWMFDASSMANEKTVDLQKFTELLPSQAMLEAVDSQALTEWMQSHEVSSIGEADCVPLLPPVFASGSIESSRRASRSIETARYLLYCMKAVRVMEQLGLRSGDPIPSNFDDLISRI